MKILIISKTHMNNANCCVGALDLSSGSFLRLLDEKGSNQPENTVFSIREIWDIEFIARQNIRPPHVEDVLVKSKEFIELLKPEDRMLKIVEELEVPIWRGNPDTLFDGKLNWTHNGSGYINEQNGLPSNSVGFWIPDRDLTKRIATYEGKESVRYNYSDFRSLKYVGYINAIDRILAGTLIRVSLARWWDQNGDTEERCYLQLSGWYD